MTSISRIYYFNSGSDVAAVVDHLRQGNLRTMSFVPIDEKEIASYPSPEARIIIPDEKAVLVWGDGFQHGVSYFFRPNAPYHKSVTDAHSDFLEAYLRANQRVQFVSGGNHNSALVRYDDNLLGLEVLGIATNKPINPCIPHARNGKTIVSRFTADLSTDLDDKTVHKSIDLDVVSGYPCHEWYADGKRSYEEVRASLEHLLRKNKDTVVRFDVGGISIENPPAGISPASGFGKYEELIELYLSYN